MKNNNVVKTNGKLITIVNISDIEDIILAKSQIDNDDAEIKYRSNLNEFIDKYCNLDIVLTNSQDINIPFSFKEIFNRFYLFCSYENDELKDKLIEFLKTINFSTDKLTKMSYVDMINNFDSIESGNLYIIKDNSYWKIG